jgi:bifunctional UDP-N-acetylglucosamine pyrophosphorylase / glucosamine-1-phosphate N-acetyltransferase
MSRQIVILAAGRGTRMAGATEEPMPKILLPLQGDKAVVKYLLEQVNQIQTDTPPIIVVGFESEKVKAELGEKYLYAEQTQQKGTGHAVSCVKDLITTENFVVLNGDMPFISSKSIQQLIDLHESAQPKITMFTARVPNYEGVYAHFESFGRIIRDASGNIIKIQEFADCSEDQQKITEVNTGEYMFNSAWLWPHLEKIGSENAQHEIYLTDIVEIAIRDNQKIESLSIDPIEIFGINTPDHLAHAQTLVK